MATKNWMERTGFPTQVAENCLKQDMCGELVLFEET